MFRVEFYEKLDGETPVEEFILSLDRKLGAKIVKDIELLEYYGNLLGNNFPSKTKMLRDGIFELRTDQSRVLYYFMIGERIILTNGFLKRSEKTPEHEIEFAKKCKQDYENKEKEDGVK